MKKKRHFPKPKISKGEASLAKRPDPWSASGKRTLIRVEGLLVASKNPGELSSRLRTANGGDLPEFIEGKICGEGEHGISVRGRVRVRVPIPPFGGDSEYWVFPHHLGVHVGKGNQRYWIPLVEYRPLVKTEVLS